VLTALEAGAIALSRVEVTAIENGANGVAAALLDGVSGERREVRARACILAGGPFTDELRAVAGLAGRWVTPTRGTHLVVPRERLPTDGAVIFTSAIDGRVMFLIPWPRATVIGTTDLDASLDSLPRATRGEVRYLLDSANALAPAAALGEADVIATYAGLRPLLAADRESPSERSREERVEREGSLYTIAGGKLTGYRAMAETLGARVAGDLGKGDASRRSPTRTRPLRGALAAPVARPVWSSLGARPTPESLWAAAWTRRYGALASQVSEVCARVADGREALDAETLLGEIDFAVRFEDALGASDFVFRRSDLAFGEPRERARIADTVLQRFRAVAGWSPERLLRERAELGRDFERMEAWRSDPV
jgi:glycerol-3-phosphate dehydrogenase